MKRIETRGNETPRRKSNGKSIDRPSAEDQFPEASDQLADEQSEPEMDVRLVEDVDEWKDKYLRLFADLENTKKRFSKRFDVDLEEAVRSILLDLLPVADDIERIILYARKIEDEELERGLTITLKSFLRAMGKHGVYPLKAKGEPFDPALHDAIGAMSTRHQEPGTVLKVEQTGYLMDGKVLRPAKVIVAEEG
ncbi:MAG: nucleotide exchange factor GrpE [Anaerolineales bacterium]|jgi:molecular chaperone GrpE